MGKECVKFIKGWLKWYPTSEKKKRYAYVIAHLIYVMFLLLHFRFVIKYLQSTLTEINTWFLFYKIIHTQYLYQPRIFFVICTLVIQYIYLIFFWYFATFPRWKICPGYALFASKKKRLSYKINSTLFFVLLFYFTIL